MVFPPSCFVAIPAGVLAGKAISTINAISEALRDGEYRMKSKLEQYKPALVKIVKQMVEELHLEDIIKIAA